MKILVTGSEGYIGSRLVPALNGHKVVRFDKKLGYDILDFDQVDEMVKGCDWIIHLAGIVGIAACDKDPALACRVNIDGTANLLRYRKPMVLSSVLAGYKEALIDETTPVSPSATYYKTKIEAEVLAQVQGQTTILRFGALYGVNTHAMRDDLLIHSFCRGAAQTGKITLFQPGHMRPITHLDDAVGAIKFMLGEPQRKGIFNAVSNNLRKVTIAMDVQKTTGCKLELVEEGDVEGRNYMAKNDKLILAGWIPEAPPLMTTIKEICNWYRNFHSFGGCRLDGSVSCDYGLDCTKCHRFPRGH